jgi:arylsulfatase A-like enzyme
MQNVILLTIDALRKDAIENEKIAPFFNSIKEKSIVFNQAYSGGPYTQAAFPGILGSSYYLDYGRTKGKCPPQRILVSEPLKNAGINTAAFHSNAYLAGFFGWNKGWNTFYDSMEAEVTDEVPYIKADAINQKVDNWLNSQKANDRPFFLWLHYMDVHEPYVPEQKYIDTVDPDIDLTSNEMMDLFKNIILKRDITDNEKIGLLQKLYLAGVVEVDRALEDFFEIIKKHGVDNSLILITADHGDEFNDHGGLSHDGKMYEELVHVPFLIYDPTKKEGKEFNDIVSTLDIPPTITEYFGVDTPVKWQGQSLLPLANYKSKGAHGESIDKKGNHEKGDEGEVHYYREGDLKIIYCDTDDSWELYDLKEDPEELNNIIHKNTMTEYMMKKLIPGVNRYKA